MSFKLAVDQWGILGALAKTVGSDLWYVIVSGSVFAMLAEAPVPPTARHPRIQPTHLSFSSSRKKLTCAATTSISTRFSTNSSPGGSTNPLPLE